MTTAELSQITGINEASLNSLCKVYASYMADGMTLEQAIERTGKVLGVLATHADRQTPAWKEFSAQMAEDTWNAIRNKATADAAEQIIVAARESFNSHPAYEKPEGLAILTRVQFHINSQR